MAELRFISEKKIKFPKSENAIFLSVSISNVEIFKSVGLIFAKNFQKADGLVRFSKTKNFNFSKNKV